MEIIKEAIQNLGLEINFNEDNYDAGIANGFRQGAEWAFSNRKKTNGLTIKNFWDASVGTWHPIDEVPINFHKFATSGNSTYYTNDNEDTICRQSDHWGSGIRECNWYLDGHPRNNSFLFSKRNKGKLFIGIIKIKCLKDIRGI